MRRPHLRRRRASEYGLCRRRRGWRSERCSRCRDDPCAGAATPAQASVVRADAAGVRGRRSAVPKVRRPAPAAGVHRRAFGAAANPAPPRSPGGTASDCPRACTTRGAALARARRLALTVTSREPGRAMREAAERGSSVPTVRRTSDPGDHPSAVTRRRLLATVGTKPSLLWTRRAWPANRSLIRLSAERRGVVRRGRSRSPSCRRCCAPSPAGRDRAAA